MKNLKSKKTSGISLVALIVTIIVLIILTAAVIVTFMEGGIIDRAKESVFKSDIRTYQEILAVKRAEEQIKLATGNGEEEELKLIGKTITGEDIKEIIPEFKVKEYGELIEVINGKIVAKQELNNEVLQGKWLIELGVETGEEVVEEIVWDNSQAELLDIRDGIVYGYKEDTRDYQTRKGGSGIIFSSPSPNKELIVPAEYTDNEGNKVEVTEIADGAFGYIDITSVIMPDTITIIGEHAFTFTYISNMRLSKNIEYIEQYAFYSALNIDKLTIPNTIINVNACAFENSRIGTIQLEEGITAMWSMAFAMCNVTEIIIPSTITSINSSDFSMCDSLQYITIPGTVNNIDNYTFQDCWNLKTITLGEGSIFTEEDAANWGVDTSVTSVINL
ncbi:MAG: leucine-rich repeat domain-containing protein [Clostridiales bacterium]|nr:leucine-rich repeat domain-containing protein [Clostridiales bacterium]